MKLADAMHELALGVAHVEQCLSRFGIREEGDEVDRMAFVQRDPDLRVVLGAADAGAVAAAWIDDQVRVGASDRRSRPSAG